MARSTPSSNSSVRSELSDGAIERLAKKISNFSLTAAPSNQKPLSDETIKKAVNEARIKLYAPSEADLKDRNAYWAKVASRTKETAGDKFIAETITTGERTEDTRGKNMLEIKKMITGEINRDIKNGLLLDRVSQDLLGNVKIGATTQKASGYRNVTLTAKIPEDSNFAKFWEANVNNPETANYDFLLGGQKGKVVRDLKDNLENTVSQFNTTRIGRLDDSYSTNFYSDVYVSIVDKSGKEKFRVLG